MVMETPSPQCVGREFVRQYYTLLHEAPVHLHRFYSHNSCFVHGGVEKPGEEQPPVMGQADIHKKIMSLNFRDCHAKIRQVDSQATVGNAVVVQVTGELSNNGEPMRRFMQTFVLAPQSPKKYYVHNDIFRYQDEVFHDNDSDDAEVAEEAGGMQLLELGDNSFCNSEQDVVENGQQVDSGTQESSTSFYDQPPPLSNGSSHVEDVDEAVGVPEEGKDVEEKLELEDEKFDEKVDLKTSPGPTSAAIAQSPATTTPVTASTITETPHEDEEEPQVEAKPFSWAAMASKNTMSGSAPPPVSSPTVKSQQTRPEPKPDPSLAAAAPQPQRAPRTFNDEGPDSFRQAREQRGNEQRGERTSMSRDDGDNDSISGRRGSRFPDSHQLFVGNLPHNISEKELKSFFEQYGKVMELRINTKSGGGKLPNFGFVVFDSPQPVQDILRIKQTQPIKYNGEHRLNVEEKKPRGDGGRMGGGGGRGGSARGGGMGRGSSGFGAPGRGNMRSGGGGMGRGDNRGGFANTRGGLPMGGGRR
ncbi:ras GTPase-activating protein-binding protein 1-like isoform X1 [Haliotis rufescens]|uniref:ras GTPase-activating protein-binding protein 1-like isoform X1 n=1 Tax=Haliotis rufescens TaxID=6454 RepID=UPI00201E8DCF|nr:ras GTPase-activating protein-binding protein 1-like isoform X1 [Haliotis rufescens]